MNLCTKTVPCCGLNASVSQQMAASEQKQGWGKFNRKRNSESAGCKIIRQNKTTKLWGYSQSPKPGPALLLVLSLGGLTSLLVPLPHELLCQASQGEEQQQCHRRHQDGQAGTELSCSLEVSLGSPWADFASAALGVPQGLPGLVLIQGLGRFPGVSCGGPRPADLELPQGGPAYHMAESSLSSSPSFTSAPATWRLQVPHLGAPLTTTALGDSGCTCSAGGAGVKLPRAPVGLHEAGRLARPQKAGSLLALAAGPQRVQGLPMGWEALAGLAPSPAAASARAGRSRPEAGAEGGGGAHRAPSSRPGHRAPAAPHPGAEKGLDDIKIPLTPQFR